ncbi:hypothetical protein FPOAC2_03965 [Fusarium poae]|jgi:hypothetical protein
MAFYISPEGLPQGSSITFYDSSFFKRGSETSTLPTPAEVLARPNFVPHGETMKIRIPAVFKELGLVVKQSKKIPPPSFQKDSVFGPSDNFSLKSLFQRSLAGQKNMDSHSYTWSLITAN